MISDVTNNVSTGIVFGELVRKNSVNKCFLNYYPGSGGGGTWVNVCWVCAAGLSEPLLNYSLFFGQL